MKDEENHGVTIGPIVLPHLTIHREWRDLAYWAEWYMFWGLEKLNSKQESNAQSFRTRLAAIRPAVQQLPVQNPQVEFRSRGGGEGESVCVCKRKATCIHQIFQNKESN